MKAVFGVAVMAGFCTTWTLRNLEAIENGVYVMRFGIGGWSEREVERYWRMKRAMERRPREGS